MDNTLMSAEDVRTVLGLLTQRQLERLSAASGVPLSTLGKIRRGETCNPGIETVRRFLPYLDAIEDGNGT
jgi:predicted transcriptional regulator